MGVKVVIPTPLRQYTERKDSVVAEGQTVEEVLQNLTAQYADLRKHLYSEDGRIRSFVNIYRNDEDIRYLAREKTPVKDSDVLSIVPSIAGGLRAARVPGSPARRCPRAGVGDSKRSRALGLESQQEASRGIL